MWVAGAIVLSWLVAPQETILAATYTQSEAVIELASFGSAWMISYVLLTFALCDAILDTNRPRARFKRHLVIGAICIVLVYFQLLRGDRAAIPFVFSVFLVYFYWAAPITRKEHQRFPWKGIGVGAVVLVMMSMIVGALRHSLTDISDMRALVELLGDLYESEVIGVSTLLHGAWSPILLTPLSVAGDHIHGSLPLKWGQDYLNLLLSIPPGFLADAVGYERPVDAFRGPAWEMRYGMGGTHASVVPFMNFRMLGVLLIPALWAYIVARYEKGALKRLSISNLALLGTAALASAHWLWYGDKYGFNALVIWFLLSFFYRVSLYLGRVMAPVSKQYADTTAASWVRG
jgi:hypothetical protein